MVCISGRKYVSNTALTQLMKDGVLMKKKKTQNKILTIQASFRTDQTKSAQVTQNRLIKTPRFIGVSCSLSAHCLVTQFLSKSLSMQRIKEVIFIIQIINGLTYLTQPKRG